ncbi:TonB family protein [Pseudooceanicola sp.]|uniref:TonB family protein n=1 Tax=Pseudooceanicola sp. TaxID=1914328 RepID=UPI0035C737D2
MIAGSRTGKLLALATAGALHAAVALALYRDEPILVEGAAGGQTAQIGSSFTDMSAGTMSPEPAEDITEEVDPDPVETPEAEEIEPETEITEVETAEPVETEAEAVETAEQAEPVENTEHAEPVETPQAEQMAALVPVTPEGTLAAVPEQPDPIPAEPEALQAAKPEPVETAPVPEPAETITAQTDGPITEMSKRPVMRDPAMETPIKRAEKPKPKPKPKPKQAPQGNAEQTAKAGSVSGSENARAKSQGVDNARGTEAGNAAASNYPGLVSRKLARVRKPSVGRRGTAYVAFSVTPSGGLGSVSLARSSGSPQIDKAALSMVRRAAPFPRPPAGAQRNFSVPIQFR